MCIKKISLGQITIYGAIFMVLAGSLMHFVYEWSGKNVFVGLISATNESVWEHSKLFILPLFVTALVEYKKLGSATKVLWAKFVQIVFMSLFITSFFYTYTGALGSGENLLVDIGSFMAAVVVGQYISYRILKVKKDPRVSVAVSAVLLVLVFASFVFFTFYPLQIPLFEVIKH